MEKNKPAKTKASAVAVAAATPATTSPPPRTPPLFRSIDWLAFLITALVVFGGYFFTLSPDLTLEDSGELAVASFYAGIPHPPGYPVWTIYTWLWTELLPIKNIAWRVALSSAFAGALACGLLGLLVSRGSSMMIEGIAELKEIDRKWENLICLVSGFVAGTLLGFNGFMWSQSVIVEVYSLSILSVVAVLLFLLRWIYAPHQRRYLYWAFFMFGICFTNHQSLIVAAMGIQVAIAAADYKMGRNLFLWNSIAYLAGLILKAQGMIFTNTNPMVFAIFNMVGLLSIAAYLWFASRTHSSAREVGRDGALLAGVCLLASVPQLGGFGLLLGAVALCVFGKLAWDGRKQGLEWAVVLICGLLWGLGAAFYLFMPIAGMTNPPMQWGYPRTVEGFMHALTRGQYEKTNPTDLFGDPLRVVGQLEMLFEGIIGEFTWVYAVLALVPFLFILRMQKRERAWLIGVAAIYLCLGVLLLILINPPPDRQARDLIRVFFTPSHVLIAMCVGYGLTLIAAALATHFKELRVPMILAGAVALDLALFSLGTNTHALLSEIATPDDGVLDAPIKVVFAALLCVSVAVIFIRQREVLPASRRDHEVMAQAVLVVVAAVSLVACVQSFFSTFAGVDETTMTGIAKLLCWATAGASFYLAERPRKGAGWSGIFIAGAVMALLSVGLTLTHLLADQPGLAGITGFFGSLYQAFQPDQYALPIFSSLLLVAMTAAFVLGGWLARERAPLALALGIFVVMPATTFMSNWSDNEQRGHLFGYWFGHDMFTPPFEGPDGEFSYDATLRAEMMKDPEKGRFVYPEMSRDAVLYGGTDPGRFCPTYMIFCESFTPADCKPLDPAFDRRDVYIITQNALADGTYLNYIRAHYNRSKQIDPPFFQEALRSTRERELNYRTNFVARLASRWLDRPFTELGARIEARRREQGVYPPKEIYIATPEDSQNCFSDYLADAQRRLQQNQLKPGEDVRVIDNRVQVSGQVAVMAINGLITKVMFDKNPDHEFYVEESFPLEWMYPHLTPHGVIMKINRQPLSSLPEEVLDRDHRFWRKYSERLIGDWIDYDTPVSNIVQFVEQVYLRRNYSGFKGDLKFARDDQGQKAFSKLRSSIGGVYAWRLNPACPPEYRPKTNEEYQRLLKEADFTFRQAFAFCPYSPEAVFRYVQLLLQFNRVDEALMVAETCLKLDPYNGQVRGLVMNLRDFKKRAGEFETTRNNLAQQEAEFRTNPGNFQLGLNLASAYLQTQQPERAVATLDTILGHPNVNRDAILAIATAYSQMQNWAKLEQALGKLTQVTPESAEAWYDYAALKAFQGRPAESLQPLGRALEISRARRATNQTERDLVSEARGDERFASVRATPEFQALLTPK